jgi:DNA helicase-2/ATP-dependent DNA helicase PcrA
VQPAARASGRSLYRSAAAVPGEEGANLAAFCALVDRMREDTRGCTLRQIIEHVVAASGLVEHYRTEKEGQDRIESLHELATAAEAFMLDTYPLDSRDGEHKLGDDRSAGDVALAAFLEHSVSVSHFGSDPETDDTVRLMTVHQAHGLEFDVVFITGLEEGLFPHENAISEADGLEEERRLMYVAITRARQRLNLSFSQTRMLHGQTRYNLRSRFFDELPEGALTWLTPRRAGFGSGYARDYQAAWARGSGLHSIVGAGRVEKGPMGTPRIEAPRAAAETSPWRPGQGVFHNKFGKGVIVTLEGSGEDARAQVNFGRHGVKWLALAVAKLTPLP